MSTAHSLILVAVIALVTALTRFLPFLLFPAGRELPGLLRYLGNVLTGAVMGMLVVYCCRNVSLTAFPFGLPEIISAAAVIVLYLWKRSTLLSIGTGTVLYMVLVQGVFC